MYGVAYEAARRPGYYAHVAEPRKPKVLYGVPPVAAANIAAERAALAKDAIGRRLKITATIYLAGVASWPIAWADMGDEERQHLRVWLRLLLIWLRSHYGAALQSVVLHIDEKYPHVHWAAVPVLDSDGRMRIASIHPGQAAAEKAKAEKEAPRKVRQAMRRAMMAWQDEIHRAVYAPLGIERIGPRRARRSKEEQAAYLVAQKAIAHTIATARGLREHYRREATEEVRKSFFTKLRDVETDREQLRAKLAEQDAELLALREQLAEFLGPSIQRERP